MPARARRALLLASSCARLGDFSVPAAVPAAAAAAAFYAFADAGLVVDIASVAGTAVDLDWGERAAVDPHERRLAADPAARSLLASPLALASVDGSSYAAVLVLPGAGGAWDLSANAEARRVLVEAAAAGGVTAAAGDGVRALIDANLIGRGAPATGPTNAETDAAGLAALVPYLVESRLRARGAVFVPPPAPGSPFALAAGRVVCGANDASAGEAARAAVDVLTGGVAAA